MNFEYKNQTEINRLLDKYQWRLTHGNPATRDRMLNVYLRKLEKLAADDEEYVSILLKIMEFESSCKNLDSGNSKDSKDSEEWEDPYDDQYYDEYWTNCGQFKDSKDSEEWEDPYDDQYYDEYWTNCGQFKD